MLDPGRPDSAAGRHARFIGGTKSQSTLASPLGFLHPTLCRPDKQHTGANTGTQIVSPLCGADPPVTLVSAAVRAPAAGNG